VSGARYLLDSHILIWLDKGDTRITPELLDTLQRADQRLLSAATAWELGIKQAAGKLRLGAPIGAMLGRFHLDELPVSIRHGDIAANLPFHHRDPFDRILLAQALDEGLILVSADTRLNRYGIPLLLAV
jgi:PIN domain nuclease of toxin-antitoxin system